jgi:hypothetical protein
MDEPLPPAITRRVGVNGCISLAAHRYLVARWLAGEVVEVTVNAGLVEISHGACSSPATPNATRPGTSRPSPVSAGPARHGRPPACRPG